MRYLVDACYLLAAVMAVPLLIYRSLRTGKYRRDWDQRRGWLPDLPAHRPRIWMHAVSMGEVNSVQGLIAAWKRRCPEAEFVVSATTDTGYDRARKLFDDLTVIRYPLDFSWMVNRALDRIKPSMIVLIELEVWPQMIALATDRGIPVTVANGRITERKSLKRFRLVMPIVRAMFARLAWVGAQDDVYAERFQQVGVPDHRVTVTSSLKWDTAPIDDAIPGSDELARAMGIDRDRPLWVCGSTGPGEEEAILQAYEKIRGLHPDLQLAIVPRKPERFDAVAELIEENGYACVRRSQRPDDHPGAGSGDRVVMLGDTMGELRKFYVLATVVFVGRTLANMGGSDMMEVAGLARPILVGAHTENFADVMRQLTEANAIRVIPARLSEAGVSEKLAAAVALLLDDPASARALAQRARDVVKRNRGVTERTLDALMEILDRAEHRAS